MPFSGEDKPGSLSFFRRRGEETRPQPAPGLAVGKVVGDFRLVSLIGQGGMGQVWEAEQVSLRRRVAVKFVRPERVTAHQLELFSREARAGGRLNHPGIVSVFNHGESDGLAWIAMELVSGAWTLKDFLDEAARAPEVPEGYDRHVARFVAEVAEAMQAAHEAAVIHRDLKPQNVLITSEDRPKVTDFGLARITDESALSVTGDFAGTYYYMSPEQVAAKRAGLDHRTDVFSLGIVLYELLALRRPFEGDTSHQVAAQILAKDPPDIRSIRSRVPRDLAVIAGKALEKDRDKRFQAMKEFAADLRRHLANEPIHATPPTRVDRTVKWIRRNPTKSTAAAIAAVAFAAITALLVQNIRTNRALETERTNLASANAALLTKTSEAEASAAEALENARIARTNEERADREATAATKGRDEVLRLSALQKLDDLVAEADRLWPAHPENIERYESWLVRAAELVAELPTHEAKLAELKAKARPWTVEEQAEYRSEWTFDDAQDKWWHNQLEKLVNGLRAFSDEETGLFSAGTSAEHGWGLEKRIDFARSLRDGFADGGHARAWIAILAEIRASYHGLALTPQLGLVPLGPDPESKLWEFAHLATGEPAVRGPDGRLVPKEKTGLVFVLLPGGTFRMGAQSQDPNGLNYDPRANEGPGAGSSPVHAVTLSPFFLSKYEMTQGQWLRFTGRNPSTYDPKTELGGKKTTLLHPVEQVSWTTCTETLGRLGLHLPTEAQWEYAARGGTTSAWWTGNQKESLEGAANLADSFCKKNGGPSDWVYEDWLDDGYAVHAPVGSYSANAFGLYDVIGNVWELCRDWHGDYGSQVRPGDGERQVQGSSFRVRRGGSFDIAASFSRSAFRNDAAPSSAGDNVGFRPVRRIAP